jgi:hypothetical protein
MLAEMTVVPRPSEVVTPEELIVATLTAFDFQVTWSVMSLLVGGWSPF